MRAERELATVADESRAKLPRFMVKSFSDFDSAVENY